MRRIKLTVWLVAACCLAVCCLSEHVRVGSADTRESDKSGDLVAKAGRAVEVAESSLTQIVETLQDMDVAGMFAQVSKTLTMLGPVFMAVSCVLSIVSIFLPQAASPEMQAIEKGFEKVNCRLEGMQGTISQMKLLVEISNAKALLSNTFSEIDAMEVELIIARRRGSKRAWTYFVEQYESNYKGAIDSLHNAMLGGGVDSEFRFDLLDLYKDKFYCSTTALSRVCLVAMQTINRGLAVEGAYLGCKKYPSRVKLLRKQWHRRLEELRSRCGVMISDCLAEWLSYATKAFDQYYKSNVYTKSNREFSTELYYELTGVASSKAWAAFICDGVAEDKWVFTTRLYAQHRFVHVNQKGKNVIVLSAPPKPDPKYADVRALHAKMLQSRDYIANDHNCYLNNQGGLYHTQTEHIAYHYDITFPGINFIVGKTAQNQQMVNTPGRSIRIILPKTDCLLQEYYVFAFW